MRMLCQPCVTEGGLPRTRKSSMPPLFLVWRIGRAARAPWRSQLIIMLLMTVESLCDWRKPFSLSSVKNDTKASTWT